MAEKRSEKEPSKQGELRRRWRAMLEDGSLAALGSEGRLVACYVQHWGDFTTCEIRFSMRYVAKYLGVQVTTVRRGVSQMIDAGILQILEQPEGSGRTRYVVPERARSVCAPPDTTGARERTRSVRAPDTLRARPGHEACAQRAPVVRAARTLCARNSFKSIGSTSTTNGIFNAATPGAGLQPAPASRQTDSDSPEVPGEVA
jgi:hypothetical protein